MTPIKPIVLFPVPMENPETWNQFRHFVERFCVTFRQHPPGCDLDLVAICCKAHPGEDLWRLFDGLPVRFVRYDGNGFDLGSHQWFARTCGGNPFLICFTSRAYFHRRDWALKLVEARQRRGPALYGMSASREGGKLHLCTRGFCLDAEDFRKYPTEISSRDQGVHFECGEGCLLEWAEGSGLKAYMVYWDGVWERSAWFDRPNTFRKGDQSNMIAMDKHTDIWANATPEYRHKLDEMCYATAHNYAI